MSGGTVVVVGNHNDTVTVYGNGTVIAGNGNDDIDIKGNGVVIVGNGRDTITIEGNGTVLAGNGKDVITIFDKGTVVAGNRHDTISIDQHDHDHHGKGHKSHDGHDSPNSYRIDHTGNQGFFGHDTIDPGKGQDTAYDNGHATVYGSHHEHFGNTIDHDQIASGGKATLAGSSAHTEFVAGPGSNWKLASGHDTSAGSLAHDQGTGRSDQNLFGGQHVLTNFVTGEHSLQVDTHSLSHLQTPVDVSSHGGSTYIKMDGGHTTIELKSDLHTHKP